MTKKNAERNEKLIAMHKWCPMLSMADLGGEFGISRQRAHKIIQDYKKPKPPVITIDATKGNEMGREIKFRAWFSNEARMFYFENVDICREYNTLTFDWVENGEPVRPDWGGGKSLPTTWKNSMELMQYTGLKDKNGKEIFESCVLNGCYLVQYDAPQFILTNISTGDIIEKWEGKYYEITREYIGDNTLVQEDPKRRPDQHLP